MAAAGKSGAITSKEATQHHAHSQGDAGEQQYYIDQPLTQQAQKKNVVFKLVDTKKKGASYIDGIADVINPKTKKVERARLISGLDTLWFKEQKDNGKNSKTWNELVKELPQPMTMEDLRKFQHKHGIDVH